MKTDKNLIVVVNGYGCHLDTPLGNVYLPEVVEFTDRYFERILAVVPAGGFTQRKSAPGVSEAGLMADYIKTHCRKTPRILIEEDSYTSYENSQKSAGKIKDFLVRVYGEFLAKSLLMRDMLHIVNFCEATRAANVVMLARHFMLSLVESIDDITVKTASWERADPFKQVGNLVYNRMAIKYPWLGLAERERARRIRRAEYI